MAFRNVNTALVSTEKKIREKIPIMSHSPIQTDVTIEVAADASSPDLMASESFSTKLARELHEKVSTMPLSYKVATVGMVAAPVIFPAGVAVAGFTTAGITAGSYAATFMASYLGYVPAGSACAVLQSIGAAGLGATGTTISSATGGAFGYVLGKLFTKSQEEQSPSEPIEK